MILYHFNTRRIKIAGITLHLCCNIRPANALP
jgi:hypothetical protein